MSTPYEHLREAIDSKLGDGLGLPVKEAASRLEPKEQVVWLLDNFFASVFDHRLHIFDQSFNEPGGYAGVRILSAIAEKMRAVSPVIADLLRWTTRWMETRGVALVSMPPELWEFHALDARRFLLAVAELWPETLDPISLPAPEAWSRVAMPGPVQVTFEGRGRTFHGALQTALDALWVAGAPDGELEKLWHRYLNENRNEVGVLAQFVDVQGDAAALQAEIRPDDPLAVLLGVDELVFPSLIKARSIDQLEGALTSLEARRCPGVDLAAELRSALRMDPDAVVVDAKALTVETVDLLTRVLETGHMVILLGESPLVDSLETSARVFDIR